MNEIELIDDRDLRVCDSDVDAKSFLEVCQTNGFEKVAEWRHWWPWAGSDGWDLKLGGAGWDLHRHIRTIADEGSR